MESIETNQLDMEHDLTQTALCELLNQKFGGKGFTTMEKVNKSYNLQDIEGYRKRGNLPTKLGGGKITEIKIPGGMIFLRIDGIQKIKELPDKSRDGDLEI